MPPISLHHPFPTIARPQAPHPSPQPFARDDVSARKPLVMRKFQISSLTRSGAIYATDQIGPAIPAFESAFSAFAHGTLIKTTDGLVAIEDLQPGAEVITSEHGPMPLLWIGSMSLIPRRDELAHTETRLTRFMADSYGLARPAGDLMTGPGARVLTPRTDLHDVVGSDQILTPARNLVDGVNIIEITPPRPVRVYHLCLHRHATINAAGLDVETFHPGLNFERNMGQNMLSLFLSFFPHIHVPSDFGPLAHPREELTWQGELAVA